MGKAKFSLMEKTMNPDIIEGRFSAFEKVPYAIPVRMSKPLAENGYGKVTVDGIEVARGKAVHIDMMVKIHCLLIPIGEVARDYDREYTVRLSGFMAEDGTPFADAVFKVRTAARGKKDPAYKEHDRVALDAAREGMVLLQNKDGVLPMRKDSVLNCFGAAQYMFRNTATGAGLINPRWQANFHQSIEEHSDFTVNREISHLYAGLKNVVPSGDLLRKAKQKSDTALILVSRTSGEFLDNKPVKGGYYLTDAEEAMIAAVSAEFEKTVAIINTGYPIDVRWLERYDIKAVLYTGFAGMCAGYALMEILDGRTNPSGKLPDTWSLDYYDNPASRNFINFKEGDKVPGEKDKGVHLYYEEDIYVGYRYFDTFDKKAAFPFGSGISYTEFGIDSDSISWNGEQIETDVTVRNTGKASGREVVQLYIHASEKKMEKPNRVLVDFAKTKCLKPGEAEKLHLVGRMEDFASFQETDGSYLLEEGTYTVFCGSSLEKAEVIGEFSLASDQVVKKVKRINQPVEPFNRLTRQNQTVNESSKLVELDQRIRIPAKRAQYNPQPLKKYTGPKITFAKLKENPELLDSFVAQMSTDELCRMNVCGGANWYMPWQNGAAGKTNVLRKYRMPQMLVSDGNTGVNIKKPNIGFPSSATIAATFNRELAYKVGKVIAEESLENGIALNLGPAMNIHRNILNGRHPEYFSEDPYLAGTMAGMHGKGLEENGVGCTYKHLFCNNSDTSRKGSHSIVSERALREIYFKVFEVAIRIQKPTAVMTSYNCVNGIYPAENADILQTLLREEWGLESLIMTDWGTYDTVDPVEMAKAGNCWLTEGGRKYVKALKKGVSEKRLTRNVLEHNVRHLISVMIKLC